MGQVCRAAPIGTLCIVLLSAACSAGDEPVASGGAPAVAAGGSAGTTPMPSPPEMGGASGTGGEPTADAGDDGVAPLPDAAIDAPGPEPDASAPPSYEAPCTASAASVVCEHTVTELATSAGARNIYWTKPVGEPPARGFPAAIIFQGSFFGPSFTWQELTPDLPFGGYYQGMLHVALLEAGFVVIEPEAEGGIAWQTNAGGDYLASSDHALMLELLERFATSDDFGPIDGARLYATGISSGGYMTSRMAVSYPGKFRALAIQSGSYATCLGPFCEVPSELPSDHPPTLFLHGDADATVPVDTAIAYRDALEAQGRQTELLIDMGIGHAWLERAPEAITAWFLAH
jgi:dienelactone hydrolase